MNKVKTPTLENIKKGAQKYCPVPNKRLRSESIDIQNGIYKSVYQTSLNTKSKPANTKV